MSGLKSRSLIRRLLHPVHMLAWQCEDFVLDRLAPFQSCLARPVLATSIPKSGTHLLSEALQRMPQLRRRPLRLPPRRPLSEYEQLLGGLAKNRFAYGHVGATQPLVELVRTLGLSVIVMVRDPRDIVVSHMEHVFRLKPHDLKPYYISLANDQERIGASIVGVPLSVYPRSSLVDAHGGYDMLVGFSDIGTVCRNYLAWRKQSELSVCWVRFEDLIGVRGGGTDVAQEKAVSSFIRFLGFQDDKLLLGKICADMYNPHSMTFNAGQVGRWREFFTPDLKDLFKKTAGRELIEMGYEKDTNW